MSKIEPLLDVKGLAVAFGGKTVVHGVDFSIAPGEKLALVGESGSGKTVTALALLRLVQNASLSGSARLASGPGRPARELLAVPEREMLGIRRAWAAVPPGPPPSKRWRPPASPIRRGGRTLSRTSSRAASASAR
jgi:ABC-type glutathione transport system ATPase component